MSELRALRLLNAVENGTVLGAEFNTYLGDAGRLAEFTVLLAQRGQAKRIANGQTTMDAVVASTIAINAAIVQATASNDTVVKAVVASALAMDTVADSASVLQKVSDNPTSWTNFIGSIYYESHIKDIIANLAGVDPSLYATTSLLVLDPASMGDISINERAMRALVNSTPTVAVLAGNSAAMALVAADTTAITLVAQQTSIMPTIAANTQAMSEIISRSVATGLMASNAGAIQAIAANPTAWTAFKLGSHLSANLKNVIANIAGLNPSDYADATAMAVNATAMAAIVLNTQAMEALATDSAAMTALAGNANASLVIGSTLAMGVLGADEAFLIAMLGNSALTASIFASATFKNLIMASTPLVDAIAANSAIVAFLTASSSTAMPATLRSSTTAADDPFDGIPTKVLSLYAKGNTIVATAVNHDFDGSPAVGTGATDVIGLAGTFTTAHVKGYTNMTWTVAGIAATAAASPILTYYDMT